MIKAPASLLAVAALAATLAACQDGSLSVPRHLRPVTAETRAKMDELQMDARAPIMIRIMKAEGQLEVWKQQRSGRYALLRSFEICRFSGDLGPKVREGDRQAPEGFYTVTPALMNPNSNFHLAFNTGYPNAFDRAHNRTGSALMVHGDCSSRGCFAMTNPQIEEIFALARDSFAGGQRGVQLQILPFRMTAENMFRFRRNQHFAFWQNLQEGSQHFEETGRPPEVQVCGRRYVFNRRPTEEGARFDAAQACPPAEIPHEIRVPVAQRQARDARAFAELDREHRQTPASAMVARLVGQAPRPQATPAHHVYATRQQVLAALPQAAPEALSLLPGAEDGPTTELRRVARGEMVGGPPAAVAIAAAAPATSPRIAVAAADIPIPAVRPGSAQAALALASAEPAPDGGLLGLFSLGVAQRAPTPAPAPTVVAAAAPATTGSTSRPARGAQAARQAQPTVQASAPPVAAATAPPGMWQRMLGAIGMGTQTAPISSSPPPR